MRQSLAKLGVDIATARRKRNLTTVMMAERIGSAKSTYLKVEKDRRHRRPAS
jgi:DNA-binding XRE family transcriptional regulator